MPGRGSRAGPVSKLAKTWAYLLGGRITCKYDQNNALVFQHYYLGGLLKYRWSRAKGYTYYNYDAAGNLTNINYPGTLIDVSLQYDALNRVPNQTDGVGTTAYAYWPGGRLPSWNGLEGGSQRRVQRDSGLPPAAATTRRHSSPCSRVGRGPRGKRRVGEPGLPAGALRLLPCRPTAPSRRAPRQDYTCAGRVASGETRYVYDGMRVLQERDGNNTPQVTYTRGLDLSGSFEGAGGIGGFLARSHGYRGFWSTHSYYHADGNGNVTMLLNAAQTAVATCRYDPFGNTTYSSGSLASANTMRFSSKPRHANSGLYYYGYRWYSPSLQRWINWDPYGESEGPNLFRLVDNCPTDLFDPFELYKVKVQNCEIVILYGHGSAAKPHQFVFAGNCSAGHFVGCESSATNRKIRKNHRIPGAPSTDGDLYERPPSSHEPGKSADKQRKQAWAAALKHAKTLCKCKDKGKTCTKITIRTELAGSKYSPDNWTLPGIKETTIPCSSPSGRRRAGRN